MRRVWEALDDATHSSAFEDLLPRWFRRWVCYRYDRSLGLSKSEARS